ncbi:DinB family protein [Paenibacillus aestuarii]|uniref:DinB family protein n=1 Tax=Paenibacillus aestuarii TaxID=516965 RepID=A0ABW0K3S2_9BACL|nr:DinB family protein [Paenibacillus aestuarii]
MNKTAIVSEKLKIAQWAQSLCTLSDERWFQAFYEGSWGTADVIAHFIVWDRFMMEQRIAYLLRDELLPQHPIDVQTMNQQASQYARSGISKGDLIETFLSIRQALVSQIEAVPDEKFPLPLPGKPSLTLAAYLESMIQHDLKHQEQIDQFLQMSKD